MQIAKPEWATPYSPWECDHAHYRYRFKRGDRVRHTAGPHSGKTGTADSAVAQLKGEDGYLVPMAGYHVRLDDGKLATVRWDLLKPE